MEVAIKVGVVLMLLISIWLIYQNASQKTSQALWESYETRQMTIEDNTYALVVADTPERWKQGLMHVRKPVPYDGMVFRFSTAETRTFWNKNTYENLKIYWMIHGEVIGTSDLPSIEKSKTIVTVQSPSSADTVVEIIQD